jgi:long-chain acyl-CoA synthetase
MPSRTLYQVLAETTQTHGDAPALYEPLTHNGERAWKSWSWREYKRAAEEIAAGLRSLGIGRGEIVALNSETRLEFYLADLGILTNGSIAAALYPSYPARDLVKTIETCGARAVFLEEPSMLDTLRDAPVEHWILLSGEREGAIPLAQLREMGRSAMAADPGLLARITAEVQPSDIAVLYLTSGATGEPKMAMVTHESIVSNIDMGPAVLPIGPEDRTVAFLPSAHIAQRVVIEFLPMRSGMPVHFTESLLKLPTDIRSVKPTVLLAPPRMWERIYSTICTELRKRPAAAQKLFYGGIALGLAAARYRRAGKSVPARISVPLRVADRLLFRKVRARFGGEIRVAASGAAPLSKDLAEFYEAVGIPLVEGYGLTEGGVAAFNPIGAQRPGSIGKALPGIEFRVAGDGELLIKGPCLFTRYFQDPATTAEVLRDGWLHTGDIGHVDAERFIYITGRKKELIVSSTGKKIYPGRVESLFKMEPLISQVMLLGDDLPHLTALFTINAAVAETLKGMEPFRGMPLAEKSTAAPVLKEVQKVVSRVNQQLAPFEQVRKYRILERDFTIENGELTATMKVRRARVMENFKDQISQLYQ